MEFFETTRENPTPQESEVVPLLKGKKGVDWLSGLEKRASSVDDVLDRKKWDQKTVLAFVLAVIGVTTPVFVLYRGGFGNVNATIERSLIVTLVLIYCILRYPLGRKKWRDPINRWFAIDLILVLLVIAVQILKFYDAFVYDKLVGTPWMFPFGEGVRVDHVAGIILIIIVLEVTRRAFSWILVVLPLALYAFVFLMPVLPHPFRGVSIDWKYLMEQQFAFGNQGVYGVGTEALLSMIFLFMLLGSLLISTKVGAFFTSFANALTGRYIGGAAKTSTIGSGLVGMVQGSAVSNVITTGVVTIPMMKRLGYSPVFAAAVEACASTGGSIVPPVLGTAAFLIAAFTGIPYLKIAAATVIPAILYYLGIFMQVHFRACKQNLVGLPAEQVPSVLKTLLQGGHLIVPVIVLIVSFLYGYSVTMSGVWAIASIIVLSFIRKETRLDPRGFLKALEQGSDIVAPLGVACVALSLVTGTMAISGLGTTLTFFIDSAAGGSLIIGLLLVAAVSLILGMGIIPLIIYLLCYTFAITTLIDLGASVMSAHLFVFYFANAAAITPPVALASFTAATIAGVKPIPVCFQACLLGIVVYFIPFVFIYRPELLGLGAGDFGLGTILMSTAMTALVVVCLASGFEGWLLTKLRKSERVLLILAGAGMVYSLLHPQINFMVFFGGVGVAALVVLLQVVRVKTLAKVSA